MSVRLDRFQLSVVDSPQNASLCVAACPGSGKSTTLACRARKLLADGVPPAQLIVLTFSTKSRDALARRLAEVGCPSSIAVSTHHAFALSLLREAKGWHERSGARVVEAREQRKLVSDAIVQCREEATPLTVRRLLKEIATSKSTGAALHGLAHRVSLQYEAKLLHGGLIDFDDMTLLGTEAAEAAARCGAPPRHTHVLLDEAQDTSARQLQLLLAAAPPGRVALTAVGDADQTIYSFRGSRPDTLQRISREWGCASLHLPTNYRSAATVVACSSALIAANSARDQMPLQPAPGAAPGQVRALVAKDRSAELDAIASELSSRRRAGEPLGAVAVLCRVRAQAKAVRAALRSLAFPSPPPTAARRSARAAVAAAAAAAVRRTFSHTFASLSTPLTTPPSSPRSPSLRARAATAMRRAVCATSAPPRSGRRGARRRRCSTPRARRRRRTSSRRRPSA